MSSTVREVATVIVSEPVSGLRKGRGPDKGQRANARLDRHIVVDPRVMEEVAKVRRPGERVRIVSETEVLLTTKGAKS